MGKKVNILFQLHIAHEYDNGASITHLLKMTNILNAFPELGVRGISNGFIFYTSSNTTIPENYSLSVGLNPTSVDFFNYTSLKESKKDSDLLYFSNRTDNTISLASEARYLPIFPNQYLLNKKKADSNKITKISVRKTGGLSYTIIGKELKHTISQGFIRFPGDQEGKYEIEIFYAARSSSRKNLFWSSTYYLDPPAFTYEWNNKYRKNGITNYTISFSSRLTYWRYLIQGIPKSSWDSTNIEPIKIGSKQIYFRRSNSNQNSDFLIFYSSDPIPLLKNPPWIIILKNRTFPVGIKLAFAQPGILNNIGPPDIKKTAFCSDIYINI